MLTRDGHEAEPEKWQFIEVCGISHISHKLASFTNHFVVYGVHDNMVVD